MVSFYRTVKKSSYLIFSGGFVLSISLTILLSRYLFIFLLIKKSYIVLNSYRGLILLQKPSPLAISFRFMCQLFKSWSETRIHCSFEFLIWLYKISVDFRFVICYYILHVKSLEDNLVRVELGRILLWHTV